MLNTIGRMTIEVDDWIGEIHPHRDSFDTAIKLSGEVSELLHAMHTREGNLGEELADCMILLLDIANIRGVDLVDEFYKKMAINRNRKWEKVQGALKHIKELK